MSNFRKPSFDMKRQISKLEERGLIIKDKTKTRHYLANISYFRLSAYAIPFYIPAQKVKHFLPNTEFNDILSLYVFDRELRLIILDAIERIEVALRAQLGNTLADNYGPHGYLNSAIFNTNYAHDWLMDKLEREGEKREVEVFLKHYLSKYPSSPKQPPIWMALELLTFSEVSRLFANLRETQDISPIEQSFGLKMPVLRSWFRSLADLRNLCAHHSRVWNREFGTRPMIPKNKPQNWPSIPVTISSGSSSSPLQEIAPINRLYFQLVIIESLMRVIAPTSRWSVRLIALLDKNTNISLPHMGFPPNWKSESFWRIALNG
ncbi:Abortive infection bacteriophage resistance protein [Oligella ureolytica]|uniref:Abi family protein n=1 Tax=Oligella ureolytica TaxID=90244 RepID=A0A378XF05_9BURK|nr:Abi family protein [Oligella ureolytica]QPT39053.1 Abi family protein [Oligella ureolytica]SUA54164.1 Abortive infection bacteriophage resistance protein [Oligella ureolytica]SUA54648.1 Abortive infection bacteriophage resistance protein [Oligella ureolytica]